MKFTKASVRWLTKWSPLHYEFLLILLFLSPHRAFSQDLAPGVQFYNRGEFDAVISFVTKFETKNPGETALANYFLAESYYNKAFTEQSESKIALWLRQARKAFLEAATNDLLEQQYNEYYHFAKYKIGWCSFRLAELERAPDNLLRQANREFLNFSQNVPDSIKVFSQFMAAECNVRANILQAYELNSNQFDEIIGSFAEASNLYESVTNAAITTSSRHNLQALKSISKIKKRQIDYQLGRMHQIKSAFDGSDFSNQKISSARKTAHNYFENTSDLNVFADLKINTNIQSTLVYLRLMNELHQYILTPDPSRKKRLLQGWNQIKAGQFERESWFRLANIYHCAPDVESDEFNELAANFYKSSLLPESEYWLGYLQMIQNQTVQSHENFLKYINAFGKRKSSLREKYLREDAQYRKYFLDFETLYLSDNFNDLKRLARQVEVFSVEGQLTRRRKEELNLLINCSLAKTPDEIWSKVLTGTDHEKLEQAFEAVRFILPRAALNIGLVRERYVFLLNRLFDVTVARRSDETNFFRGIVGSLEAEIQATPKEKVREFKAAAKILSRVQPDFHSKSEADYIQAICLFFADEFEAAVAILKNLVNEQRYMRALFYLAEIFRLNENSLAAKHCYRTIIRKLQDSKYETSKFWIENSQAALEAIEDKGSLAVLSGIDVEQVEFQPALKTGDLFYEKLADERLLIRKYRDESLGWLIRFGPPAKTFYPSKNRLKHSFAVENSFDLSPFELNEIRGPLTASLRLRLLTSEGIDAPIAVRIDDEILAAQDDIYLKPFLPLNSKYEITVETAGFYPVKMAVRLTKLGVNEVIVPLSERLRFQRTKSGSVFDKSNYSLKQRWDSNVVLNRIPAQNQESELVHDFSRDYHLRDFAVDQKGNRILAIHAKETSVRVYSADASGRRMGRLQLSLENQLNSPEGITVDTRGDIFIADWKNHRVLQVNGDGVFLGEIGGFGTNRADGSGNPIKLVFPTRVTVLEDSQGITVNGKSHRRESYLCVADQNGIHLCKLSGEYLGTLLAPDKNLSPGSFFAFIIQGYGRESTLQLADRHGAFPGAVFEFSAN